MLRYLLEKEFKQIFRDKFMPRILFLVPVLQLIILPFAANFEMENINLSVVDNDKSTTSVQMINKVLSSGYFTLVDESDTYSEAIRSVEDNEADIILEIPHGFEKKLGKENSSQVLISANAVNGTKGAIGSAYLGSIIQDYNIDKGFAGEKVGHSIRSSNLYNPHLSYKNYMVPGIMAFLLTIIGGFISALNIVREKERGTIEQINVSPVSKPVFILSKLIPFWVIGFILLTVAMIIAVLVYGLVPEGSILTIYAFAIVYMTAFTGYGLAISSFSSTQYQAMFTAFFFMIIFVLLSGLFTPVSSMPEWAQTITLFNPVRYFIDALRMIYLKGSTFADVSWHFIVICMFAVGFNALAIISYRKRS